MNKARMTVNTKEKADSGSNRDSEGKHQRTTEASVTLSDIKTQWHPAFCAATELELWENKKQLEFDREYNLGKKPLQIDLLIVEKRGDAAIVNEIGRFFRKYNIIEYKSPGDELTIDDFFKTLGYAYIYKGLGKTVNQIPVEQMTVSLVREGRPVKLLHTLKKYGHTVEKKFNGIYYIGGFSIPVQIVVTRELESAKHHSLRMLSRNALEKDIRGFVEQAQTFTEQGDRENVDAVLQVSASVNYQLFEAMKKGDGEMCEAMRRLMNDEIQKEVDKAVEAAEMRTKEAVEAAEMRTKEAVEAAEMRTKEAVEAAEMRTKEAVEAAEIRTKEAVEATEKRTKLQTKQEMAFNMKQEGLSDSKIAKIMNVGIEIVQQWFACGMTPAK